MALFNKAAEVSAGYPVEPTDEQIKREEISVGLWNKIGVDEIAKMNEDRYNSVQATIDKLTNFKMKEAGYESEEFTPENVTSTAPPEGEEPKYGENTLKVPEVVDAQDGIVEIDFADPQFGTPPVPEPDPNQRTTTIGGEDYNPPAIVPPLDDVNTADEPVAESTVLGVNTAELKRSQAISGIYEGLVNAETSTALGLIDQDEWWKRTGSNGGAAEGSSAFGPAQITKGLFKEVQANPKKFGATAEEMQALEFYIMQGEEYLKYGNESDREGYTSEFDYSMDENNKSPGTLGSGYFSGTDEANKVLEEYGGEEYLKKSYRSIAEKILGHYYDKTEGDVTKIQNYWRYGEKGSKTKSIAVNDPEYAVRYKG